MRTLILLLGLSLFGGAPSSALNKIEFSRLDDWANDQVASLLKDCGHRSSKEIFTQMQSLRNEFSVRVDALTQKQIRKMKRGPGFLELGEVLFPVELPSQYPMKGSFLICDETHQDFIHSKTKKESRRNLEDLKACFQDAYRLGPPEIVGVLLKCYDQLDR